MKRHSLLACLLAALLLMGLLGCGTPTAAPEPTAALTAEPTAAPTAPPTPEPTPEPTASPAPAPKIISFYFDEPDAFAASPDNPLVLSVADDDSDDSGILVSITPKDDAVLSATQADAGETVLRAFWAAYLLPAEQVDAFRQSAVFTVSECERTAIEEAPALRMRYTVQYEDLPLDVLQYTVVSADSNYSFLFCDATAEHRWHDAFLASAATIDLYFAGETLPVDTSGLTRYQHNTGLALYMQDGMVDAGEIEGFDWFLCDPNAGVPALSVAREDAADLAVINETMETLTLEEYAAISAEAYGLNPYAPDDYGNLYNVFTREIDGATYFYYVVVKKGTDAFWTCNFACPAADYEQYLPQFMVWAASIETP